MKIIIFVIGIMCGIAGLAYADAGYADSPVFELDLSSLFSNGSHYADSPTFELDLSTLFSNGSYYADSPTFELDLSSLFGDGSHSVADSNSFSMNLYPVSRVWADSAAFEGDFTDYYCRSCEELYQKGLGETDGEYTIDPDGIDGDEPVDVDCLMSLSGGGWTKLTDSVANTQLNQDSTQGREYLFVKNGLWYRTPVSYLTWDWFTGKQLTGTYYYFDGSAVNSFELVGSTEVNRYGIGCSNGVGNQLKVLIGYDTGKDSANGVVQLCQDQPGIFGSTCQDNVLVYIRESKFYPSKLYVVNHVPSGMVAQSVSHVDITFSGKVNADSFTVDDVYLTGPNGVIAVDSIEEMGQNIWRLNIPIQSIDGKYHIQVGPLIEDLFGYPMDQDCDDLGGEESDDVYDGGFEIDKTPPMISFLTVTPKRIDCSIYWSTHEPATHQIEYGLTDAYGLSSPVNNQFLTNHTVNLIELAPDTIYHYRIRAKDRYGNETITADATFTTLPDVGAPNAQIMSGPTEGQAICSLPIDFSWTGTDDITPVAELLFAYQMDVQGWSGYSSATSVSYADLSDGLHTFEVKAMDSSGNEDPTPAIRHFIVDASGNPPQISSVSASVGQQQAVITWATDKAATTQVEYGLTDAYGLTTPFDSQLLTNHTVTITGLTPQTIYYYRVKSQSGCGIESASGASFTTAADTTTPESSITTGPSANGTACENTVEICWTGSDNFTPVNQLVYSYRVDSGSWSEWSVLTCQTLSLTDGQHTVEVKSKDSFGNEDPTPARRTFKVDTVSPSLFSVHTNPKAGSATIIWNTDEVCTSQVEYGLTADYGHETTLSSGLVAVHNVSISSLEPVTTYHYRVKSLDGCGRVIISDDFTFTTTEDTTDPDTYFASGPAHNGKTCDTTVGFSWIGGDDATPSNELQYSFKMDNEGWSAWTTETSHSFVGLSEGLHTVLVKARDDRGNEDSTPAYRNFFVDLTSPVISNISVAPRDYRAAISWNTSEPANSQVEYGLTDGYGTISSLDSSMTGAHTITIRGLTPQTAYHFRVKSNDGCREVISEDQTFTTTEILPPNLSVTYLAAQETTIAMATINVTWRVTNKGPGDITSNWLDGIYLSTDAIWDSNDIEIQTIAQNTTLSEGSQYSRSAQLEMPLVPEGNYYLIAKTDVGQTVSETDENDNFLARPIQFLQVKTMVLTPSEISLNLNPTAAVNGQLSIGNLSIAPLTGITAVVDNASPNISVQVSAPSVLDSMQTGKVNYTVIASDESVLQNSPIVRLISNEGEEATIQFNIRVNPRYPRLSVYPGSLEAGMLRGTQTLVECEIANNGAVSARNMVVQLPSVSWMSLVTPASIGDLGPGEKSKIVVSLMPSADLVLGPYTGNIAVTGANAGMNIGFRFNAISDKKGSLKIAASDEFTYYAENNPPVTGAKVELKDTITGQVVIQRVTDANGICEIAQLTEGYYNLEVSAEKHSTYRSTVEITGGQLKDVNAFLARQFVTYTWDVVPIELEDRYEVHLETTFETHVPAPVITVDPMVLDITKLTFDTNGKAVANYTITNYGFIGVKDVNIQFGSNPRYSLTPLMENIGNVNAMSSVVVPVTITDINIIQAASGLFLAAAPTNSSTSSSTNPCGVAGSTKYTYDCGGDRTGTIPLTVVTGQCPSSSTPYISGGGSGSGGSSGGGGGGGSGNYVVSVSGTTVSTPTYNIQVDCNPCLPGCLSSAVGCLPIEFLGYSGSCYWGLAQCGIKFNTSNFMLGYKSSLKCLSAFIGCLEDYSPWTEALMCLCSVSRDCVYCAMYGGPDEVPSWWVCSLQDIFDNAIDIAIKEPLSANSTVTSCLGMSKEQSVGSTNGEYFLKQYHRVVAVPAMLSYILGDAKWFDKDRVKLQPWLDAFYPMIADESEAANSISESELSDLLELERPTQINSDDVQIFVVRWNRTVDYLEHGILSENDLPSGWDPDFIAYDKLKAIYDFIVQAEQDVKNEGFESTIDALRYAKEMLIEEKTKESKGVCGRVEIKLDQQAAITRTAFKATLKIENAMENVNLENVHVMLNIQDANSVTANDKFGIHTPELTNISDVNGAGTIVSRTTASAVWIIIPTRDAAPDVSVQYYVGGTLEYDQDGSHVSIPLFPVPIMVKPDPLLVLDYFLVRDVYSDDPFTPQIEPAEPFSLCLLMSNQGKGSARNIRITSSQPQIIENEKGLLVDFKIIGTQVNSTPVSPSLTVNLGDIGPDATSVAQWLMTSSLQGKFTNYCATFEHIDDLGNKQLSLIDSVNIHELTHVVRVDIPGDDNKPDFLANDVPDDDYLPDTLYNSDGSTAVVNAGVNTSVIGSLSAANLQIHLNSTVSSGWSYIRADDPGMDQFRLVRIIRSDGREIKVSDNAWTTHRTIRLVGQPEYREHLLHILDKDSTGSYTLIYEEIVPDKIPPTSSVLPLPAEETSPIFTVCWSGEDNSGGSGLKDFDIYVSDNGGDWQLWLSDVIINCASYVGVPNHNYRFYSIARDVAGNVEESPLVPDAETTTPDDVIPQTKFVSGDFITTPAGYLFTLTYSDNKAIDILSLNSGDIKVTGPNGFEQYATFVDVDAATNGTPRTVRYSITAPGGSWDFADNGVYSMWIESNQVIDTSGNAAAGGLLKTFTVTDNSSGRLELESYSIISTTRVGRTAFEYIFTVTLKNNTSAAYTGVEFELFNAPANMTIISSNVNFATISAGQSATSEGMLKVRIDRSATTDLYGIPWRITSDPQKILCDFNGDSQVNLADLTIFASYWLSNESFADIAPLPEGDCIVNFLDFAECSKEWDK